MSIFWISCVVILWVLVLFMGFLLLGTLRSLGLLNWRLEQLEATTPKRLGRHGLKPGKKAPDFTLLCTNTGRRFGLPGRIENPSLDETNSSLHDFTGRKVLLVFTQSGCGPCKAVIPELNRLARRDTQVLVVNNGDPDKTRKWSAEVGATFPVLAQDKFSISKKYEVYATPFAFLIDEKGVIVSKGIIHSRQHIRFVLSGKRVGERNDNPHSESNSAQSNESEEPVTNSSSKEFSHV
jgi:methylamine dehydrogenase accessory protein MauD